MAISKAVFPRDEQCSTIILRFTRESYLPLPASDHFTLTTAADPTHIINEKHLAFNKNIFSRDNIKKGIKIKKLQYFFNLS